MRKPLRSRVRWVGPRASGAARNMLAMIFQAETIRNVPAAGQDYRARPFATPLENCQTVPDPCQNDRPIMDTHGQPWREPHRSSAGSPPST